MGTQVSDPTLTINNVIVAIVPNTLSFTEGLGEQAMTVASAGGGNVEPVFSNNVETNLSMIKFEMPAFIDNIAAHRAWKAASNQNLVQISGRTPEGVITRTFSQAAVLSDTEIPLQSDANIAVEFKALPAI